MQTSVLTLLTNFMTTSACAHYILAFTFSSANVTCGHYIYTVSLALQFFSLALAQFSDDPRCWPQCDSFTLQNKGNHMQKTTSNGQNILHLDTFVPCNGLCIFFFLFFSGIILCCMNILISLLIRQVCSVYKAGSNTLSPKIGLWRTFV